MVTGVRTNHGVFDWVPQYFQAGHRWFFWEHRLNHRRKVLFLCRQLSRKLQEFFPKATTVMKGRLCRNIGSFAGCSIAKTVEDSRGGLYGQRRQKVPGVSFGWSSTASGRLVTDKLISGFGSIGQYVGSGRLLAGTEASLVGGASLSSLLSSQTELNPSLNEHSLNQLFWHTAQYISQLFTDKLNPVSARWSQLQASWVFGKAKYASNAQPLMLIPLAYN